MKVLHLRYKVAAIALFGATSLVIFVLLFRAAGGDIAPGTPYSVSVVVPNAYNLVPNADVRASGVRVGRVADIVPRGSAAELRLELDERVAPVFRDATVLVRTKTLVGESYLGLEPGTPRAGSLPDGGRLSARAAGEAVQLDDILGGLDAPTRRQVRRTLAGLARGLGGRGEELNETLGALRDVSRRGDRLTTVLGAQRHHLARLVDDTGGVLSAIGEREGDLRTLVRGSRAAASAVARRDAALHEGLGRVPGTLRQADRSIRVLQAFSGRAVPVVQDLRRASGDLTGAVRRLEPASRAGRELVEELARLVPVADPLLTALSRFSVTVSPSLRGIDDALREVNPVLRHLEPFSREIGAFFANQGAWNEISDATGRIGRVQGVFSERALAQYTPEMKRAVEALLDVGALRTFHDQQTNAYPRPGDIAKPLPGENNFVRVQRDP